MLLNLSNHPFDSWSEKQKKAALESYGEVSDMAFPAVDPLCSGDEIESLAHDYLARILALQPQAVHIMGEMTFVFRLVVLLKSKGILCLASTTARIVQESVQKKTSIFEFVQFRTY